MKDIRYDTIEEFNVDSKPEYSVNLVHVARKGKTGRYVKQCFGRFRHKNKLKHNHEEGVQNEANDNSSDDGDNVIPTTQHLPGTTITIFHQ